MPSRLDDDKRILQFLLTVERQDPLKFGMNGILRRGQDRGGIDILVGQESQGIVARRMSSTATTSIAY